MVDKISKQIEMFMVSKPDQDSELLIRNLKKLPFGIDVYMIKNPLRALDYIKSTGPFENKSLSTLPKLFLLDGKYGQETCEDIVKEIRSRAVLSMVPIVIMEYENTFDHQSTFLEMRCEIIQSLNDLSVISEILASIYN